MLNTMRELCNLNGVSGWEDKVRDYIKSSVSKYADKIFEDSMGNLFVFKSGKKRRAKRLMVCAHMDEVGLIIKNFTEDGYLKFAFSGGVDRRVAIGKRVRIGADGVPGIIGVKAVHLTTKDERKKVPKLDELYIDIGATSRAQVEKLFEPGDFAAFDSDFIEFGDGLIKAKAIDDRFGCAAMLEIIHGSIEFDTWFVFTVQEEVGLRGAAVAAYSLNPDAALILEGTTAADLPNIAGHKRVCQIGDGAVIGCADFATIYDKDYYLMLRTLAERMGIPWQIKRLIAGGTDAGAIHTSRGGVKTASISLPVRYIHSPSCVAGKQDIEYCVSLAKEFINHKESDEI